MNPDEVKTRTSPLDMNQLRRLRYAKGWTQAQLARAMGTSTAAVSAWENGKRIPWSKRFPKLAQVLGVDTMELTRIVDPRETPKQTSVL